MHKQRYLCITKDRILRSGAAMGLLPNGASATDERTSILVGKSCYIRLLQVLQYLKQKCPLLAQEIRNLARRTIPTTQICVCINHSLRCPCPHYILIGIYKPIYYITILSLIIAYWQLLPFMLAKHIRQNLPDCVQGRDQVGAITHVDIGRELYQWINT